MSFFLSRSSVPASKLVEELTFFYVKKISTKNLNSYTETVTRE